MSPNRTPRRRGRVPGDDPSPKEAKVPQTITHGSKTIRRLLVLGAIGAAVPLSGCSFAGKTHQSSPALWTNRAGGNISQFPSGFRNVASKCVKVGDEWFAVFSGSSSGNDALAAWPDPSCAQGLGTGK